MVKKKTPPLPKPKSKASAIPVGTQFSPALVDLRNFVKALLAHSGDAEAIKNAVWKPSVRLKKKSKPPTKRNRSLPVEAAVQYGLLDKDHHATALAQELAATKGNAIYDVFARHILLNCGGLRVLEGITQMEADNRQITGDSLARFLTEQDFTVTEHNTAINSLRMWLEMAGVLDGWEIDHVRREEIVPSSSSATTWVVRIMSLLASVRNVACSSRSFRCARSWSRNDCLGMGLDHEANREAARPR